jgi:hypothetical protein
MTLKDFIDYLNTELSNPRNSGIDFNSELQFSLSLPDGNCYPITFDDFGDCIGENAVHPHIFYTTDINLVEQEEDEEEDNCFEPGRPFTSMFDLNP